jgi:hypothetical protein
MGMKHLILLSFLLASCSTAHRPHCINPGAEIEIYLTDAVTMNNMAEEGTGIETDPRWGADVMVGEGKIYIKADPTRYPSETILIKTMLQGLAESRQIDIRAFKAPK